MNSFTKSLAVAGLATLAVSANATITPIGQFSGSLSETFESFDNYSNNPFFYEAEPFVIMGGGASVDSITDDIAIFEPSAGATWGLVGSGGAVPSDGTKGMGIDSTGSGFSLTFASDQNDFGAFWALATFGGPSVSNVEFYDSSMVLVGSTSFSYDHETTMDGILEWNGWNSDVAFRTVTFTGDWMAVDGMQASSAVPEPATMSVLALGALAMLRRRKSAK